MNLDIRQTHGTLQKPVLNDIISKISRENWTTLFLKIILKMPTTSYKSASTITTNPSLS